MSDEVASFQPHVDDERIMLVEIDNGHADLLEQRADDHADEHAEWISKDHEVEHVNLQM